MAAPPLVNPPMPLLTPIPGGFTYGKIIRVKGMLSPMPQRFAINLQCGPNTQPRDDMALHFNVRMAERAVVRNSLVFGQWGHEEKHGHMFPFVPGQAFEILFLADSNQYKIAINGQHFTEFHCRMPMERVSYLSADGDITIHMITFEGGHGAPGQMPMPGGHVPPMPMPAPAHPGGHVPPHGAPYPPGMAAPYPTQPGMPYPAAPGYPGAPGGYPAHYAHLSPKSAKKAAKKQAKAQKKAMKYGLPMAAAGVGAYALHKGVRHGFHGHSSSSSSSSSEEE